MDKRRNRR